MEANVITKVYDAEEAAYEIRSLKKLGYTRTSNCFWVETWEKDGYVVQLERDF